MGEKIEFHIKAPFKLRELDSLPKDSVIDHITISRIGYDGVHSLLTAEAAERLTRLAGIKSLSMSCDVSRAALPHIARIPQMEALTIEHIRGHGKAGGFEQAKDLRMLMLRYMYECSTNDIRSFLGARGLRYLSLLSSNISARLVADIAELPDINELDLEATILDDSMAEILKSSDSLRALHLGATRLTRKGLRHLAEMKQLKKLDLWACGLSVDDLSELEALPNLEYLSFGTMGNTARIDAEALIAALGRIPALKEIWLDTVDMTPAQISQLKERYEKVRVDLAD